ncbi:MULTISPECIES: hypothetical protein, partial [unclassified Bradyrhizobium]|uniref:hypothetical protein n=1 Tax=unclassified Bradyrhizobium TaxID=2631580 RepID=UPI0029169E68
TRIFFFCNLRVLLLDAAHEIALESKSAAVSGFYSRAGSDCVQPEALFHHRFRPILLLSPAELG